MITRAFSPLRCCTLIFASLSAAALLAACSSTTNNKKISTFTPVTFSIVHVNDHHSNLDHFSKAKLKLAGQDTRVELGGFARITKAFKQYSGRDDVLKLHAGDAITGTLYYTLFGGQADADMMNTICFDALVPGNHAFDDGDKAYKTFIDAMYKNGKCQTPIVAANIHPRIGTPLAPKTSNDYFKPYIIKTIKGVRVGIIGITIKGKTINSSRPLKSTQFDDEVVAAQRTINQLKSKGIRHIILLTHQGYENDKRMAAKLTDVDAIIGGDSHSLLGNFKDFGLSSSGAYPTQVINKDGAPVCIGQAWEYSKAMGEMQLSFNSKGELSSCSGQASLIIGKSFKRKNASGDYVELDRASKRAIMQQLAADKRIKMLSADSMAASVLKGYSKKVAVEKAKKIGAASEALCLVRIPGESTNRSASVAGCEKANTLGRGSDAAQVVAQSFLEASRRADIAIQNAGGVRTPIGQGQITMNTAFTLLPYKNVLIELPLTGKQLHQVLEDAASNHLDAKQSSGSHPYAAGLRWSLDMSKAKGQRFSNLQARNRRTGKWSAVDPNKTYIVATNDYIASGKDGYKTFGTIYKTGNYVNNYLLYTQTFVDYVKSKSNIVRPQAANYAHQSVITADGKKLPF